MAASAPSSSSSPPLPQSPPLEQQPFPLYKARVRGACDAGGFTLYALEMSTRMTTWQVFKRFRELYRFFNQVITFPSIQQNEAVLHGFPEKRLLGSLDAQVVAARRAALTVWLEKLLQHLCTPTHEESLRRMVHAFLDAGRLSRFAFTNDVEMMAFFVDVERFPANQQDRVSATPLHYAASQGHEDMCNFLMQKRVSTVAEDCFGNTPVELARRRGHDGISEMLLNSLDDEARKQAAASVGSVIPTQYEMLPQDRRVLLLVNPFSGKKKARAVYDKIVRPVFELGGVHTRVVMTEYAGHAGEVVAEADLETIDTILCVSGDGLLFEVVNALASRHDSVTAIKTPVGIIPAGTGNGLAKSQGNAKPLAAVLNFFKGYNRPIDLMEVTQPSIDKTYYCFLMVAWGLLSDIDLGSESHRWMGEARFTFTAVQRVLQGKQYKCELTIVPADADEGQGTFLRCRPKCPCPHCRWALCQGPEQNRPAEPDALDAVEQQSSAVKLTSDNPAMLPGVQIEDGKYKLVDDFQWLTACNTAWVSGSDEVAPMAHASDGCIDLIIVRNASRADLASYLLDFPSCLKQGSVASYLKVKEFSVRPLQLSTSFDVDGEFADNVLTTVRIRPGMGVVVT